MTTVNSWHGPIPYFPKHELACKGTDVVRLDLRFAAALPALREAWGEPLTPTSICRAPRHNELAGGHPRSLHLTENRHHPTAGTMAADLAWRAWSTKRQLELARLAWSQGWAVGLHDGFIHVDLRRVLPLKPTVFLYGAWSGPFAPSDVTA